MSIDTAAKRSSALDHEEIWQFGTPLPDGTVTPADRQHLLYSYSGILMSSSVDIRALTLWLFSGALTAGTQSAALAAHDANGVLTADDDA